MYKMLMIKSLSVEKQFKAKNGFTKTVIRHH